MFALTSKLKIRIWAALFCVSALLNLWLYEEYRDYRAKLDISEHEAPLIEQAYKHYQADLAKRRAKVPIQKLKESSYSVIFHLKGEVCVEILPNPGSIGGISYSCFDSKNYKLTRFVGYL